MTNISPGHNYLIKHPLLEAIIISKWKRIELIWIIYMLLKLSFMGIFITLGVGTLGLQQFSCNVTELGTTKGINSRYIFVTLNTNSINYRSCSISRWFFIDRLFHQHFKAKYISASSFFFYGLNYNIPEISVKLN